MSTRTLAAVCVAALVLLSGCSDSSETPDAAESPTVTATTPNPSASDGASPDAESGDATPGPYSSEDVTDIAVNVEDTGVTGRPLVAWPAIDGVASYELVVLTPSGERYWTGQTSGQSLPIGGAPLLGEQSAGARLVPGLRWFVVGRDADGFPVAQSMTIVVS